MKLMKLLLIGLLSVGTFIACDDTTDETPIIPQLRIVQASDNITVPVLYDNVSIKLSVIDVEGKVVQNVVWTDTVTGGTFDIPTATIKSVPTAQGVITATVADNKTTLTVVPSKAVATVVITPATTILTDDAPSVDLISTAIFENKEFTVTSDTEFTAPVPTVPNLIVTIEGEVSATGPIDTAATITGIFNGVTGTATVTSTVIAKTLEELTFVPATAITLPKGAIVSIKAMAKYDGVTEPADVTSQAVWDSTDEGVATVVLGDITGVGTTAATNITAVFGGKTATVVVNATAAEPASFTIAGTTANTILATSTNQLLTTVTNSDDTEIPATATTAAAGYTFASGDGAYPTNVSVTAEGVVTTAGATVSATPFKIVISKTASTNMPAPADVTIEFTVVAP